MAARKRTRDRSPAAGAAAGETTVEAASSVRHVARYVGRECIALCGYKPLARDFVIFADDPEARTKASCEPCLVVLGAPAAEATAAARRTPIPPKLQAAQRRISRGLDALAKADLARLGIPELREAVASVALDRDPDARTYCLQPCALCGLQGTADVEVVWRPERGKRGLWLCAVAEACADRRRHSDRAVQRELRARADSTAADAVQVLPLPPGPVQQWPLDKPCPAPHRNGRHELYTSGELLHCRACGASQASDPALDDVLGDTEAPAFHVDEAEVPALHEGRPLQVGSQQQLDALLGKGEVTFPAAQRPGVYLQVDLTAQHPPLPPTEYVRHEPGTGRALTEVVSREVQHAIDSGLIDPERLQQWVDAGTVRVDLPDSIELRIAEIRKGLGLPPPAHPAPNDGVPEGSDDELLALRAEVEKRRITGANIAERLRAFMPTRMLDVTMRELIRLASLGPGATRTLGFDPGFRKPAALALDATPSQLRCVHRELFTSKAEGELRLDALADWIDRLVWQLCPQVVAMENVAAVHAGAEQLQRKQNASARRQLEVAGMIRSAARRYGARLVVLMPRTCRATILGEGNTKDASKHDVRRAVEGFLGLRGLQLDVSDAGALAITGFLRDRQAQAKAAAKPRKKKARSK
jgi:Holliday junction resolvasome RuvABC endonuclease subunit